MAGAGQPMYVEIAETLRRRARQAPAGDPLPSESELAAQFGVSRMTARQAVKALESEGLLYRVPGSGTFASGHEAHRPMGELRSFTAEMSERGLTVRSRVLYAGWIEPARGMQSDLGLSPRSRAIRVRRVRFANDVPMALEDATLTPRCSFVLDSDLNDASLHSLLEARGIIPTEAFGTLIAAQAQPDDATHLQVELGAPLLVERRRIDDQFGTRIESTETRYAGAEYVFDVHLRRPNVR